MKALADFIPIEVAKCLEEHYYLNIGDEKIWDELLAHSKLKSFTNNIETLVNRGTINIVNFVNYMVNFLNNYRLLLFNDLNDKQYNFFKTYSVIMAALVNIDLSKQSSSKLKILKCLNGLTTSLDGLSSNEVFDLISLPFLFDDVNELLKYINNYAHLNKLLNDRIDFTDLDFTKYEHFMWLTNLADPQKYLIINCIRLNFLLKKIFFNISDNKSYGHYQCLLDSHSGRVLYSIRYKGNSFLLSGSSTIAAADANIESVEIINGQSLIINFKQGLFFSDQDTQKAAFNAALQIDELYSPDIIVSDAYQERILLYPIKLLLESPADNAQFTDLILDQLYILNPKYRNFITSIPSLTGVDKIQVSKYLNAENFEMNDEKIKNIIEQMKNSGQRYNFNLNTRAFENVKEIVLEKNEILIHEDSISNFVYIPMSEGLEGYSQKNQTRFLSKPWSLVGHIAVIQNSLRTATVLANRKMSVLMIPAATYLNYWHAEYTEAELKNEIENHNF